MKNKFTKYEKQALAGVPGTYNSFLFRNKKLIIPIVFIAVLIISVIISANKVSHNSSSTNFNVQMPTLYYFYNYNSNQTRFFVAKMEKIPEEELTKRVDFRGFNRKYEVAKKRALFQYYGLNEDDNIKAFLVDKNNNIVIIYYSFGDCVKNLIKDMKRYGIWEENR